MSTFDRKGEAARNAAMMAAHPRPMCWTLAGRDQFALLLQSIGQAHRSRLDQLWLDRLVIANERLYPANIGPARLLGWARWCNQRLPPL